MTGATGTWKTIEDAFFAFLEKLMVALLVCMVVMVFGNVLLRWTVNSGLDVSEEMSRFFFVWLTFIGAVVVARENAHLGVDALVGRLGPKGRLVCMVASDLLILFCCAIFFWGTQRQAGINATNFAPVTGISMLWVFGVGYFTSVAIGAMTLARLVRALLGKVSEAELAIFAGQFADDSEAALLKRARD
ncbi:MAG: TRAP transporter small permease [Tagaea sp.]|nr:TRAP transporter small permease [Tagaea sp.]